MKKYAVSTRSIAKALKTLLPERNLSRNDIFITTKIPTDSSVHNPAEEPNLSDCKNGVKKILSELDTEYIDLLLIHSPPRSEQERKEAWQCLEHFYHTGEAKSIGKYSSISVGCYLILLQGSATIRRHTLRKYWDLARLNLMWIRSVMIIIMTYYITRSSL